MTDNFADKWCLNFAAEGHEVRIFGNVASATPLPVVYMHTIADEGAEIWQRLLALPDLPPFVLVEVAVPDWFDDMTPWPGPALTPKGRSFGGKADAYMPVLTDIIVPRVQHILVTPPKYNALVGYSLAGLFALYSLYRTPVFQRIGSVSGSLWYYDFINFISDNKALGRPRYIYLSLGDKEGNLQEDVLNTVQPYTGRAIVRFKTRGHEVAFEHTRGNHFTEPEQRMVQGIANILRYTPAKGN